MKKCVLITGGSRGIGAACAIVFAKENFNVAITYNQKKEEAQAVKRQIENLGQKCLVLKCNLENENEIESAVKTTTETFGKIDVLVNNAAVSIDTLFQDKTADNFRKTLNINLVGTFLISKIVGQQMVQQKSGKIVNIASTNGLNTYYPMCLDYDASKAGLISLTHNLAMQFAPYVNVNAVAPGFIATKSEINGMDEEFIAMEKEKIFLKRVGTEEDVANLVLFLASDKASFINSEVVRIDGGMYGS